MEKKKKERERERETCRRFRSLVKIHQIKKKKKKENEIDRN